jgi:hypothetical protein
MADHTTKRSQRNHSRVSVLETYDRHYWSRRFGCTEEDLGAAVEAVGVSKSAVEKWLRTNGKVRLESPQALRLSAPSD